jgi:hypothetical protein
MPDFLPVLKNSSSPSCFKLCIIYNMKPITLQVASVFAYNAANHRKQKAERIGAYCCPSEFALLFGMYFDKERENYLC